MAEQTSKMSTASVVIVARHGERLDYSMRDQGGNWQATADRPYDTPLTKHGHEQGEALGRQISQEIQARGLPDLMDIYSSPFLRCRQTAMAARRGSAFDDVIKVETGLAESINEAWFRSWALQGSNGTWGYRPRDDSFDPSTFHPKSKEPVPPLLDWKKTIVAEEMKDHELRTAFDLQYESVTSVDQPYRLHPPMFETNQDQRKRMREVVDRMSAPGKSILLVSHGGPVTHLFEELTGEPWQNHGESSYCCYSIYVKTQDSDWQALVVNEAQYLHERIVTEKHVS